MKTQTILQTVKVIHTIAWTFFAGCTLAIPFYTWMGNFEIATVLCAIVFIEVLILVGNNWNCPLTSIAARYTENRQDNFDIYLPGWLARYNKVIFGSLYLLGIIYTFTRWKGWL